MKSAILRFFGLRGSWSWACRQLEKGYVIRRKSTTGTARYAIDTEGHGRIRWAFPPRSDPLGRKEKWDTAFMFLSDFYATDWETVDGKI